MAPRVHLAMAAAALLLPCILGLSIGRVDPQPCCSPDQWEVLSKVISAGNQKFYQGDVSYAFDYTNQLLGVNMTYYGTDGTIFKQNVLIDGKAQKAYRLDVTTRRCSIGSYPGISRLCVQPVLNYATTVAFRDASQEVDGNVFVLISPKINVTLTMTKQLCAPMSQMVQQAGGGVSNLNLQSFYNFTVGIRDRSVFNVPSECKNTEVDVDFDGLHLGGDASAAQMRKRRSLLQPDMPCTMFSPCWMMRNK